MLPLFSGLFIAISFAAPPGPVTMETIRRGVQGGFRPAFYVQLGSIIGDSVWCGVALLGLAPLAQIPWVRVVLGLVGVGLLLYLGGIGLRDVLKPASNKPAAATTAQQGAFRSGLAISMANPMAVGYWLSVGGALVAAGMAGETPAQTAVFALGFLLGTFAWALIMALAVRWSRVLMTPPIFRIVNFVCSSALLVFGLLLGVKMASGGQ